MKDKIIFILIGLIFGAIAMDAYIYMKSKNLNYSKSFGLFKYTSKNLLE